MGPPKDPYVTIMVELATMTNNKMKKVLERQEHNGVYNINEHQYVKKVGWMAKGMTHSKQQKEEHITYHHWKCEFTMVKIYV